MKTSGNYRLGIIHAAVLLPACLLLGSSFLQTRPKAKDIIEKAEQKIRGKTSIAEVDIQIVRPSWTRTMKIKAWTKGDSFSVILITAPVKDKGTVFLKRKKEVWQWLPSIERVIKLPPSMMTQSWMGTDFTNDDLVKESSMTDDYAQEVSGDTTKDGRKCWILELIPKSDASVVWGKVILWIDQKDYLEMHAEFMDEDSALVNVMNASDIKMLGGKLLPAKMEMLPVKKTGQKTVLTYNTLIFNQVIPDNFFTVENIKNVK